MRALYCIITCFFSRQLRPSKRNNLTMEYILLICPYDFSASVQSFSGNHLTPVSFSLIPVSGSFSIGVLRGDVYIHPFWPSLSDEGTMKLKGRCLDETAPKSPPQPVFVRMNRSTMLFHPLFKFTVKPAEASLVLS